MCAVFRPSHGWRVEKSPCPFRSWGLVEEGPSLWLLSLGPTRESDPAARADGSFGCCIHCSGNSNRNDKGKGRCKGKGKMDPSFRWDDDNAQPASRRLPMSMTKR